jgi:general secretion pathway protein L
LAFAAVGSWLAYSKRLEADVSRSLSAATALANASAEKSRPAHIRSTAAVMAMRKDFPVVSIMLEALSQALPDDAVLDRLEYRDRVVTLTGRAKDVPGLIKLLEGSRHFTNVDFAAPTVREDASELSVFSLTARVDAAMSLSDRGAP